MCNNRYGSVWLVMLTVLTINSSFAQTAVKIDSNRVRKSFAIQLGGGFGGYTTAVHIKPPSLSGSINRFSAVGTARLMWYPSYRLRMGFESGYTNFYSYKVKNGNATGSLHLSAVPLLFVFSMQVVRRVNIYAGIGAYLVTTHLDYDTKARSRALVLGSNFDLSYTLPLTDRLGLIAETEWMNAYDSKDASLSLQVKLSYRFLQWR